MPFGWSYLGEYVRIGLPNGKVTSLTSAPAALRAGWTESLASPAWSDDSLTVLLPGTFLAGDPGDNVRPCLVAVKVAVGNPECIRPLKRERANGHEAGYERLDDVSFVPGRDDEAVLGHFDHDHGGKSIRIYRKSKSGSWTSNGETGDARETLKVDVNVDFKTPPTLVATNTDSGKSRIVFDPNPQLKHIALGEPELYSWKDDRGREWEAILYKPLGFRKGVRYPLVIQNHGFSVDRFVPSGGFPSADIAQELASAGIMVVHLRDCAGRDTPMEGPCNVEGYESIVAKLSREGLIDPERVGIIGFSRTVFYTLEALTTSTIHFRAASVTDGLNLGYFNYLLDIGPNSGGKNEQAGMIGASPTGAGLVQWLKASPVFNMDKVTTPLRVVATRDAGLLQMWEPYALLEELHKPVDLVILNTKEHIVTDPSVRLAAQEGNLDWFRFWLQGWEDPDPSKKEQYVRWRALRAMDHP
jgi:hypothetical protein